MEIRKEDKVAEALVNFLIRIIMSPSMHKKLRF